MEFKNWQEITMDSESFEPIRQNFDMLLQRLFQKMEQNNSDEGKITLTVNIKMECDYIPDPNGGTARRINKPTLKHKINTEVPVKDSFDGQRETGMELVYDEELKRYVLKYVSAGGQRSIFDEDFQNEVYGEAREVDDAHTLPGPTNLIECDEEIDVAVIVDAEFVDSTDSDAEGKEQEGNEETNEAGGRTEANEDDEYEYEE